MKYFFIFLVFMSVNAAFAQTQDKSQLEAANRNLAAALQKGDHKTAVRYAEEAVEHSRKLYGDESREAAIAHENLGIALTAANKHKHAVEPLRKAVEIFQKDPSRSAADISNSMQKLGEAMSRSGQEKEAEALFANALTAAKDTSGTESAAYIGAKTALACHYLATRQSGKGFGEFAEAYSIALRKFGRDSAELDKTALSCEAGFIRDLWKSDDARKKLNAMLGYELARPIKLTNADHNLKASDIGRPNVVIHEVVVKVKLNESGRPTDAKIIFGRPNFSQLATSAALDSTFKPSMYNGKPIEDVVYILSIFVR